MKNLKLYIFLTLFSCNSFYAMELERLAGFSEDLGSAEVVQEISMTNREHHVCKLINLKNNKIASTNYYNKIEIWSLFPEICLHTLSGHDKVIDFLIELPNDLISSASYEDDTIKIWDIISGECLHELKGHKYGISSLMHLSENKIISGSYDDTIRLWDIINGECLSVLRGHTSEVTHLIKLDERTIVSGSFDSMIKVWDLNTNTCQKTFDKHIDSISSLINLSGNVIASGSEDHTIRIWEVTFGQCLSTMVLPQKVSCLLYLPNKKIASASGNTIKIWDVGSGKLTQILEGHEDLIEHLIYLDKNYIATGSKDKTIRIWNLENSECVKVLTDHKSEIFNLIKLPNEAQEECKIISDSKDTISIYDIGILP